MIKVFTISVFFSAVILLVATSTNAGLDEELVFYLSFDNITDQTIVDKSGNGLDAEIIENTEIVKGKYGKAIHITDEGLNCVNIPSQEQLKVKGEITMMAWIYYPETWKGKKVHWLDKGCHSGGWEISYGIAGVDAGNGPEIRLFLGERKENLGLERHELIASHKMGEEKVASRCRKLRQGNHENLCRW